MPKLTRIEIAGALLFGAALLLQYSQHGSLSDDMLLMTLPGLALSSYLLTADEGSFKTTGLGFLLAQTGIFWQMGTLQARPKLADDLLLLTGALVLAGAMLLSKSRRLTGGGMVMVSGWGSVAALWLSTQFAYGTSLLLALSLGLLWMRWQNLQRPAES